MSDQLLDFAGISIERLHSFCQIVESGSVVAASRKHGVSQGQYSRQIRDLERTLDVKLFQREGKYLRLTTDGIRLSALTNAYFEALAGIRNGPHGIGKPLRLGAPESVVRWTLVPRFLEVISAAGGPVDVETHATAEIIDRLQAGEMDVGIFRADAATDELETFPFPELAYVLMVPRSLLPDKSATAIANVQELPLVMLAGDGKFVAGAERVLMKNGVPFRIVSRVQMFSLAVDLAKTLGAASFVPTCAAGAFAMSDYAPIHLKGMDAMTRKLVIGVSVRIAALNTKARRAAMKLSRAFEPAAKLGRNG
jgi:DNA-binding transcriptional LysR family regulator